MPKKQTLTEKQIRFIKEYKVSGNATDAYRKVYKVSDNVAAANASALLRNPKVSEQLEKELTILHTKLDLKAEDVLKELHMMATVNLADAFKDDGSIKLIGEMPENLQRALSSVDSEDLWEGHGQDRVFIGDLRKFKIHDKTKSLELLGRYFKLFTDVVEVKDGDKIAERLANARKRKK